MRILFIGCIESSYDQLQLLIDGKKDVVGVITKEKSKINSDFCDLSSICKKNHIPFIYSDNIADERTTEFIKSCNPDIGYCFGWSWLIPGRVLKMPKKGIIGNHPAELPYNRGRHPIVWALALGLERTAATFFVMNEEADAGDIISQEIIPINKTDYARDLYNKINESECRQILEFTEKFENGIIEYIHPDLQSGNVWRKRGVKDGLIDWRMSAEAIYNLIRALSEPYIGAGFLHREKEIKVWRSEIMPAKGYCNVEPGKVIRINSAKDFIVKTYDDLIHITECAGFYGVEGEYL